MGKFKRVLVKEELVALTSDFLEALILSQMLYWSLRVDDFDLFFYEEKNRNPEDEIIISESKGWIYKTLIEIHEELMLGKSFSRFTLKRRLDNLINKKYIHKRVSTIKNGRTFEYRVNVRLIQDDLKKIGYTLEGYPASWDKKYPKRKKVKVHDEHSNVHHEHINEHHEPSNVHGEHSIYNTEITTETTQIKTDACISETSLKEIIEFLNQQTLSQFNFQNPDTQKKIKTLIHQGYTAADIKAVIQVKTKQWLSDPEKSAWLRPKTLFNPNNFESYLQEAVRCNNKSSTVLNPGTESRQERISRLNYACALLKSPDKKDYEDYIRKFSFSEDEIQLVENSV